MTIEIFEHEKLVLHIVQDYLNQNKYFNMKNIIPYIKSRLKIHSIGLNNRGIEQILKSLVHKKLLVEGKGLTRLEILNNKKRKGIYNFIVDNPGTYLNRIVKSLKISKQVVVWHINMLLKFGFIKKSEIEDHDIFFDAKMPDNELELNYITSKEKSQQILQYLKENTQGLTKTHLARELEMHHNTVTKYLGLLEDMNVIIKKKTYKKDLYFLRDNMIEVLNLKP